MPYLIGPLLMDIWIVSDSLVFQTLLHYSLYVQMYLEEKFLKWSSQVKGIYFEIFTSF